jgi:hypothetical protein
MDKFLVSPDHTSPGAERAGGDTTNSSKRKVQDISYDDTIEDIQHDIEKLESVVENIKNIINDKRTKKMTNSSILEFLHFTTEKNWRKSSIS